MTDFDFDQGTFNFDAAGDELGFRRWREELDARKHAFETRWGIILGRRVSLQLASHNRPIEGIIRIDSEPAKAGKTASPLFRIGTLPFCPSEIESIVALNR